MEGESTNSGCTSLEEQRLETSIQSGASALQQLGISQTRAEQQLAVLQRRLQVDLHELVDEALSNFSSEANVAV